MSKDRKHRWHVSDADIDWTKISTGRKDEIVYCTSDCPYFLHPMRNDGKRGASGRTPDEGKCTAVKRNPQVFAGSSACLSPESRG